MPNSAMCWVASTVSMRPKLEGARGFALAAANRRAPIGLDHPEIFLAPLVAKRLSDQIAERVHILAQRLFLDLKLNCLAIHNARLVPMDGERQIL